MVNMIIFFTLSFHCHFCIYKLQGNGCTKEAHCGQTYAKTDIQDAWGRELQPKDRIYRSILFVYIPAGNDKIKYDIFISTVMFSFISFMERTN